MYHHPPKNAEKVRRRAVFSCITTVSPAYHHCITGAPHNSLQNAEKVRCGAVFSCITTVSPPVTRCITTPFLYHRFFVSPPFLYHRFFVSPLFNKKKTAEKGGLNCNVNRRQQSY